MRELSYGTCRLFAMCNKIEKERLQDTPVSPTPDTTLLPISTSNYTSLHQSSGFPYQMTSYMQNSFVISLLATALLTSNGAAYTTPNRRDVLSQSAAVAASSLATTAVSSTIAKPVFADELATTSTDSKVAVPTVKMGSLDVSRTIQGYWQLAGGHGKYKPEDAIANMRAHYKAGITTLDTADIYGPSEKIMGQFMAEELAKGTKPPPVPNTKFCCFRFLDEIDKNEVKSRILSQIDRLQVPSLSLVQYFWYNYDVKKYVDVALMLTELKEEGLIQEIGATNFDLRRLKEMKDAGVPIVSHQVQMSALDRRPVQSGMADWCLENDVKLIAFGTVGSGILSEKYLGAAAPTQQQQNTSSMRMYSGTASRFGDWSLVQELLRTMSDVAENVRVTGRCPNANISNIAQRYVLDATPAVGSVLIGVRNQNHIEENVRTHEFTLTSSEIGAINDVVAKRKGPKGDVWDIERGYA